MATPPPTIVVDPQLAAAERTSAQEMPLHMSAAVNGLSSLLAQRPQPSAEAPGLGPSTAAILSEIFQTAVRAMDVPPSTTSKGAAQKAAQEAAEKARAWSNIGSIIAVVVVIIIAILVTIFSFGAAGTAAVTVALAVIAGITNSVVSAIDSVCRLMLVAEQLRHPLAARFAAAVSQISKALQNVTRNNRYDTGAVDAALREILQALRTIEGLGRESAQVIGPCTGDPDAVYQCGRQLAPLLARLAEILQTMRLLSTDQTQAAIRALQTANLVLTRPRIS